LPVDQAMQRLGIPQLVAQLVRAENRVLGQQRGGDSQRERQIPAHIGQLGGAAGISRESCPARKLGFVL
jgi:hypothetical protein